MSQPRPAWLVTPAGQVAYDLANEAMHDLAARRLADEIPDVVIVLEHPPVFTAGRRAKPEELLWDESSIAARGALVRRIDRGGAFTYHGPGQVVAYPILNLGPSPDAARYLRGLEASVIDACARVGAMVRRRDDVQTGVWAGNEKVCAIGVRLLRARVTLHGLALNCDTDLAWFAGIIACGLPEHGVTSLSRLLGRDVTVDEMRPHLRDALATEFGFRWTAAPPEVAARFAPVTYAAGASATIA
jgi:lipoyl(octanoyl) transferase